MKTGLIMEGGAMRGMFTAGVIDVLMEAGVSFDGAIGVSAGAVFGCNYKSRQIGRVIRYNKAYCQDPRYVSFRSLLKTGDIYGEQFCYHELPDRLDPFDVKTYAENPMNFYVVCTDADTGKAVYHNCLKGDAEDIQWMRASASMPALSRFVKLDSYSLSDGGTADSIPVRFFESIGYDRNVVILTQPEGYVKKPNQLLPLLRILLWKNPALIHALENRHERYNETLAYIREQERSGNLLVIRPEAPLNIGAVERHPEELERVYQIGRKEGEKRLREVKKFQPSFFKKIQFFNNPLIAR